ncbi:DNA polymerase alpha catalytic subunit-like isoform X1 [Amphibalanus amphitrite]|uniref:DNA polymerase alpha catalytic subunit-like isoform X1 n=1 Tax=Amphibalanus amphitrite TaxID=1232801 RepID=UPI001C91E9BA|nr:DNA polymerase alpha catalytic subunit-like isoform X1 [Amphibalanus amphitrite]
MLFDLNNVGLAAGRSRRSRRENTGRTAALDKIRSGQKNKYEVTDDDRVYDVVDESEYSRRVQERLEDDWIVDDGGGDGYVEDGREIFDDDIVDDGSSSGASRAKRKSNSRVRDPSQPKKSNIRDMLLNMPGKKPRKDVKLEEDTDLQNILQDIKASPAIAAKGPTLKRKPVPGAAALAKKPLTPSASRDSLTQLKTTPVARTSTVARTERPRVNGRPIKKENSDPASQLIEEFPATQEPDDKHAEREAAEALIQDDDSMFESMDLPDGDLEEDVAVPAVTEVKPVKTEPAADVTSEWQRTTQLCVDPPPSTDTVVDASSLPLTTNANGDQVLRFFWLDAYCDNASTNSVVYLFGRVWVQSASAYVSCCVRISNVPRRVFLLPRKRRLNPRTGEEGDEITMKDVYEEFNNKIASRFKIAEFRSKVSTKSYAFEKFEVPNQADYLEVMYSSQYQALPQNLEGETFSHVFGANTSTLEAFLIGNKVKGPCWLEVKNPAIPQQKLSFCTIEAAATLPQPGLVSATTAPPPPLTVLTLATRTVVNSRTHQSELVLVSCLVHKEFRLDAAAPTPLFQQHFCALTKPADAAWPYDIDRQLTGYTATTVRKCVNEKALISFFLAKMNKLDPDIVVGHNVYGFDLDVLLSRCRLLKVGQWAHMGRLRRSGDVLFRTKFSDDSVRRSAMCGRLLCDTFLSAKELTRQKSYDLPELCRTVLRLPDAEIVDLSQDKVSGMFTGSRPILDLVTMTMQEAHNAVRVLAELNALPLALQITCLAGNLMSRTLLGGRAERNEFLLLHAFTERGYIVPDKQYGKRKFARAVEPAPGEEDAAETTTADSKGRRKPKYGGGLVLDPKKGFYDRYILLMDFNSLYPSIIQEYNICFTTLPRLAPTKQEDEDDEVSLEMPADDLETGVLPMEIKKLVDRRRAVKQLMKAENTSPEEMMQLDVRQKALKLTANSMYGCLGFDSSRFYAKHLAALITAKGRDILMQTKSLVERMDLEVVYGDTDSIMINSRQLNYDQVMELGKEIKREVNKLYKLLELDVDGLYRYMLLLKKKKYAAVAASRGSDGVIQYTRELKGLDIVRRDWSQLSANCGTYVIDQIFSALNHDEKLERIHTHLEAVRQRLEQGQVPLAELAITKELKKNPEEYADKKGQAHVNVALRVNSRGGKKLRRGDTVQYIICKDNSGLDPMQRAYSVDEVAESQGQLTPDVEYYLSGQVHPVVSRLVEPLEGTDAARLAQALGLDPSKFRQQVARQDTGPDSHQGLTGVSEAQRFAGCQPLLLPCVGCRQQQKFASVFTDGAHKLRMAQCDNDECKAVPVDYLPLIVNKLRLEIRNAVRQYLQGVLYCEDPGCPHETRRIPFRFERGFPTCDLCHKAVLIPKYDDRSLYNQLCYYQHIFDLKKALDSLDPNQKQVVRRTPDFAALEAAYHTLSSEADAAIRLSNYSHIDLGLLFQDMMLRPAGSQAS